jgi:hypothetical protein
MPRQLPVTDQPSAAELATVRSALTSFGVSPAEDELASIAHGWDLQRAAIDRLYAAPEARYAEPALRFKADAVAVDWTG